MAKKKSNTKSAPAPVDSIRHHDKRKNIPTEELRDFVTEDEQEPKLVLYPRDPSLDPQLVWKGKDEQDQQDLAVPAVPIYIQEKIHSQGIIDDFRASLPLRAPAEGRSGEGRGEGLEQLSLFSDFNGLPDEFDKRVDLPPRRQLVEPADPGRFAVGDELAGGKRGPARSSADDLHRPAVRDQVRQQLAGQYAEARREGRQGRA